MGAFTSIVDDDFKDKYRGIVKGTENWESFYGDEQIDKKLNLMMDEIAEMVEDTHIFQLFLHRQNCPSCQESIPKFRMISNALEKRLKNYKSEMLEINEKTRIDGTLVEGEKIIQLFVKEGQTKGVPTIIQNLKINKDGDQVVLEPTSFFVSYVGKVDPFRFLATSFNIDNKFLGNV